MASQGNFLLAISVELKPEGKQAWLEGFGRLAKWVKENEPETLAFEVSEVEGSDTKVFVFERFTSKSALKDVHQQSEPYFEFKKFADGLDCVISKEGFGTFETGLGYVGR